MESATVNALQTEVEFYRQNQTAVEEEIRTLICDNQKLSQQVGILLKEKLDTARQTGTNHEEQGKDNEELRKQVALLAKERDSLHVLWQTSQKTIEALETELKTYQNYDNRGNQNAQEEKRDLDLKLETALSDYIELEKKHKELKTKYNTLENNIKSKEKEIASYKERGKELEDAISEMTRSIEEYKIKLEVYKRSNEDLKNNLSSAQKEVKELNKRETEAKAKVAEALQLYDAVTSQKNIAFKTIQQMKSEVAKLKHTLSNVREDVETVCKKEVEDLKEKYNEKLTDMLEHIRHLDAELVEKGLLLNKTLRENRILQAANESYLQQQKESMTAVDPKLALAEQRMEAMFQELVASQRRNIQVECEKQCLAIDIQRLQDIHTREIKRRDWEENILKNQCEELKVQVEHLQKSLDETHGMVNKLQDMLSSRSELNQRMVSTKEEELVELNKHLENQMALSKKWKDSYVEMTEKLKAKLQSLSQENIELRISMKKFYNDKRIPWYILKMKRAKQNAGEKRKKTELPATPPASPRRTPTPPPSPQQSTDECGMWDWNKIREEKIQSYVLDSKGLGKLMAMAAIESDGETSESEDTQQEEAAARDLAMTLAEWNNQYLSSVRMSQAQKVKCQQFITDLINSSLSIKDLEDGIGTSLTVRLGIYTQVLPFSF